jgi:VWFA-related protein
MASSLLLLQALLPQEPTTPPVVATVAVERVLIDARVLHRGRSVRGLGPEHFQVRVDGEPAELDSVTWISAEGAVRTASPASSAGEPLGALPAEGRRIVFLVQKELHPTRTGGLLRMLEEARKLIGALGPDDRVAILSFDSHLKLWRDFTADRKSLDRALEHDVVFETRPRYLGIGPDPSLAAHLGLEESRRAATPETALKLVAEALVEVEGSKTLIILGHGFGQLSGPQVTFHGDYDEARRALLEAEVTVFSFDVTDADHHTLEVGLQEVAHDTGGFYARTHVFSGQAMSRLQEALAGHYILEVVPPRGPRGRHDLDVDLVGAAGRVYARAAYFD